MPQAFESEVWWVTTPLGAATLDAQLLHWTANDAVKLSRRVGPQFEVLVFANASRVLKNATRLQRPIFERCRRTDARNPTVGRKQSAKAVLVARARPARAVAVQQTPRYARRCRPPRAPSGPIPRPPAEAFAAIGPHRRRDLRDRRVPR